MTNWMRIANHHLIGASANDVDTFCKMQKSIASIVFAHCLFELICWPFIACPVSTETQIKWHYSSLRFWIVYFTAAHHRMYHHHDARMGMRNGHVRCAGIFFDSWKFECKCSAATAEKSITFNIYSLFPCVFTWTWYTPLPYTRATFIFVMDQIRLGREYSKLSLHHVEFIAFSLHCVCVFMCRILIVDRNFTP